MTILFPALAVAFAAFCVWLTVRIVNRRERWAKWTLTAVVATLVLYPLSVGPVRWVYFKSGEPELLGAMMVVYDPLWWAFENGPHWLWWDVMGPYIRWWTPT